MSRKRKCSINKEEKNEKGKRLRLQLAPNHVLEREHASRDLTKDAPHVIELFKYEETDESGEETGLDCLSQYSDGDSSEGNGDDENDADQFDDRHDSPATSKVFNDTVHGHIDLHPLCVMIVDTPQFQRLRNIKQLGCCYFVYPGATNNRFEHCIGTSHLARKLVKSLKRRQPGLGITKEDMLCVEVAGLCHDLGHGPFSHMFDKHFIPKARPGRNWKHEDASLTMFDHMVEVNNLWPSFARYNLTRKDMIFIKELIIGTPQGENQYQDWPFKGRGPEKSFLYEIVANKRTGVDVDKFDYFARDCRSLGINNSFDHKRFMKFARVIEVSGRRQICVRDKEAGNIYEMFHTRNILFRRACQHKTSNIIEEMINEALLKADKNLRLKGTNGRMTSLSEAIDDMVAFTQLTDHVFYQILLSDNDALSEAREILMRIQRRDLYKCIGQTTLTEKRNKSEIPEICANMAACLPRYEGSADIEPDDFVVHIINFDYGMCERNPIDEIRFYHKEKPDTPIMFRKEQVSHMLPKTFAEQHMRVYCRKNEPKILAKARNCFIEWCNKNECTTPKEGNSLPEFTPVKPLNGSNRRRIFTF